jgi:predicted dehydrogenase
MRSEPPRVAIVGAGLMGQWHALAARRADANVVAVVDPDPQRCESLARRVGAAAVMDFDQLRAADRGLSVAHLCTPAASHAALACRAFDLGLHVVCEKPLGADAASVQAMLQAARRAQRQLLPVHQYTAQRGMQTAKAALPRAGRLLRAAFVFHSAGAEAMQDRDALIDEILPHPLSVLASLNPALRLSQVDWSVATPQAGECEIVGIADSAIVSIAVSSRARPTRAAATLAFEAATIELDFFHGFATVHRGKASRADKALRPFTESLARLGAAASNAWHRALRWEAAYPGLRALLSGFYASLREEAAPSAQEQVIDIYQARDRIVAAARTQRSI